MRAGLVSRHGQESIAAAESGPAADPRKPEFRHRVIALVGESGPEPHFVIGQGDGVGKIERVFTLLGAHAGKTDVEGLAVTVNRHRLMRRSFDVVALVIRQRQADPEVCPQTLLANQVALVALYNQ